MHNTMSMFNGGLCKKKIISEKKMRYLRSHSTCMHWLPIISMYLVGNNVRETLHTNDEKVRGNMFPLPNSSRMSKHFYLIRGRSDAMMDDANNIRRKLTIIQTFLIKIPIKTIICFFKINLNGHKHFVTPHFRHRVHHFLSYNNTTINCATINKTRLIRRINVILWRIIL